MAPLPECWLFDDDPHTNTITIVFPLLLHILMIKKLIATSEPMRQREPDPASSGA
jgi:hypothetical protein